MSFLLNGTNREGRESGDGDNEKRAFKRKEEGGAKLWKPFATGVLQEPPVCGAILRNPKSG